MPDSVVDRILPARFTTRRRRRWAVRQQGREGEREGERGRSNELGKAKPEMFDVWIEEGRTLDILKWEDAESESMVVSCELQSGTHFISRHRVFAADSVYITIAFFRHTLHDGVAAAAAARASRDCCSEHG